MTHDENNDVDPAVRREEARLDELIASFGADYNRPPDIVPTEEMWARIAPEIRRPQVSTPRRRLPWQLVAAAAVMLGFGVAIGRGWDSRRVQPLPRGTASAGSATAPHSRDGHESASDGAASRDADATAVPNVEPRRVASARPVTDQPSIDHATGGTLASAPSSGAPQSYDVAYQVATLRHFTNAEALMTTYRTSPHDARTDAQMASWARDLLSQTRLLLDSPAAADPARRRLLQDLELVLVEMSQLSPNAAPVERELIDGSVQHGDMMTRLRLAVPAGGAVNPNGQ